MTEIGYTAMCEQTPVKQLVLVGVGAEQQAEFLAWSQRELLPALREPQPRAGPPAGAGPAAPLLTSLLSVPVG